MRHISHMLAALAVAGMALATPAVADPNHDEQGQREAQYLYDVHRIDPHETRGQDQLLADGQRACAYRRAGHESINLPGVSATEAAYALTDLCPEVGDY
jgi:hypothetical protein